MIYSWVQVIHPSIPDPEPDAGMSCLVNLMENAERSSTSSPFFDAARGGVDGGGGAISVVACFMGKIR